jgi:6-phosphogluconolactonase
MTAGAWPAAGSGEPEVVVMAHADAVSVAAAERIADALTRAVEGHGRADWATTGGSSAIGIYQNLEHDPIRDRVPWRGVHLWWGDDRYVPPDHPLSNVLPASIHLLAVGARSGQSGSGEMADDVRTGRLPGAPIPAEQVHPIPIPAGLAIGGDDGIREAARRYEAELRASGIGTEDGWPVFDLVILGIGPDGHLLSVFPGSEAFDEPTAWAVAIPAPTHVEPHIPRVTLNPRVLDHARDTLVVVQGAGKAEILERIFGGERDPRRVPAQLVRRPGVTWILDRAAAERLPAGLARSG